MTARPINPNDVYSRYFSNKKVQSVSYPNDPKDGVTFIKRTSGLSDRRAWEMEQEGYSRSNIAKKWNVTIAGVGLRIGRWEAELKRRNK
jgi:hypothetical protein